MKLHLPKALLRAIVAVSASAAVSNQVSAADFLSWENAVNYESIDATIFLNWNYGVIPKPYSISDLKFAERVDKAKFTHPDGAVSVDTWGMYLDASGNRFINSADGYYAGLASVVETTKEISGIDSDGNSYTLEVGTFLFGTAIHTNEDGVSYRHSDTRIALSDYTKFSDGLKTQARISDYGGGEFEYVGGAINGSSGSTEERASTTIIMENGAEAGFVTGGVLMDVNATAQASYIGDNTIIVSDSRSNVYGSNYIQSDAKYGADFSGKVNISIQGNSSSYEIIGGIKNDSKHASSFGVEDKLDSSVTIIAHRGSEIYNVVGGNSGNAGSFKGDVTIHVDARLEGYGSVIGANNHLNASDTSFTGDTNIRITEVTEDLSYNWYGNAFSVGESGTAYIVGGIASENGVRYGVYGAQEGTDPSDNYPTIDYTGKKATLVGNTNVTIDLSNSSATANGMAGSFGLSVLGGSIVGSGQAFTHTGGSSNVVITGAENVRFDRFVVGGNIVADAIESTHNGLSNSHIDRTALSSGYIESVNVSVDSGSFLGGSEPDIYKYSQLFIVGSVSAGGGNATTGQTNATISGGTFNTLIGGNASLVKYDQFDGRNYLDTSAGKTVVESNIVMNVSGGSVKTLVGGSYIDGTVTDILDEKSAVIREAVVINDTDINVTGGLHGNVTSGSYIGEAFAANKADGNGYLVTQGNLSLSITGDTTISGASISAAGIVESLYGSGQLLSDAGASTVAGAIVANHVNAYQEIADSWPYHWRPTSSEIQELFTAILDTLTPPPAYAGLPDTSTAATATSVPLTVTTESTHLELGDDVKFTNSTVISGDLLTTEPQLTQTGFSYVEVFDQLIAGLTAEKNNIIEDYGTEPNVDAVLAKYDEWIASIRAEQARVEEVLNYSGEVGEFIIGNSLVKGNRQLELNGNNYAHIANVSFTEFDEIATGNNAIVDLKVNNQDLDLFAGRNELLAGSSRVTLDAEGKAIMTGTNTVRKTGNGTLMLSATNGQVGREDNLQLVVEEGKVVLAANSAATTQTNFKTLAIQSGATLDMSAGSNTAGTAAGINGHLILEENAQLIADASRCAAEMGTSMIGGMLSVDAKFMLTLSNLGGISGFSNSTFTINGGSTLELGLYQIVLFSDLAFTDSSVSGISFLDGTWQGESAKIALATDYMNSNFYMGDGDAQWETGDTFIVWRENGDFLLTSGTAFAIPEPSTATLSLLALGALFARRRRKQA